MQCLKIEAKRHSTVMLIPPKDIVDEIVEYNTKLFTDGLIEIETRPHITILHGLLTNDVNEVSKVLTPFHPIRVMFGKNNMFMADNYMDFDIVRIDVFGEYLTRLRRRLLTLENKQTYMSYVPHITLAAVRANYAIDYVGQNPFIGRKFVVDELLFSPAEGEKVIIKGDDEV